MAILHDVLVQWGPHRGPHGPMDPHWGTGSGMMPGGGAGVGIALVWPLLWLILVALVVIAAVYLIRSESIADDQDRAMELLREQYARGEITDEEFDERSAKLAENNPTSR